MVDHSKLDLKLLHDLQNHKFSDAEDDVKRGADVNVRFDLGHGMYNSLLNELANNGNVKAIDFLIKHHVDTAMVDGLGETVLTSLSNNVKNMPEGERKENILQIIILLKQDHDLPHISTQHPVIGKKATPRENGLLDDPTQKIHDNDPNLPTAKPQPLSDKINAVFNANFHAVDGKMVMDLTAEQVASINKFSFEHPAEAEKLFPGSMGISLSLETKQITITNYDELEKANQAGDVKIGNMLSHLKRSQQAMINVLAGNYDDAVKSINQGEAQEKISGLIQLHGLENLRPQYTQIQGGEKYSGDIASQSVGIRGKSVSTGIT